MDLPNNSTATNNSLFSFKKKRIAGITAMLQQSLEGLLLEGLQTSNIDIIRHCLRTYATIDKTRDAEALVGQVLVKPYIDEVSEAGSNQSVITLCFLVSIYRFSGTL